MKRSSIPQSSFKSMARAKAGINVPLTGFQTVDYRNQAERRIVLLMPIQWPLYFGIWLLSSVNLTVKLRNMHQERPENSGRIFTLDIPAFIAISAFCPGRWFRVHHGLCPNYGLALSIFLLFQKSSGIVLSTVPVSSEIRFSACLACDSMNSTIQWHL